MRPHRWLGLSLVVPMLASLPSVAIGHDEFDGWTRPVGETGILDYTALQTVAVGDDGSIYVAGHTTASFSADTGITGFDVTVEKWSRAGELMWARGIAPFGPGIPDLDIDVDGAGNVWLLVNNVALSVYDGTDGSTPAGSGPYPTFDGDPKTNGVGASDAGYLIAEIGADQVRAINVDGTTTWTHALHPDTGSATITAQGANTILLVCRRDIGIAGHRDQWIRDIDASGTLHHSFSSGQWMPPSAAAYTPDTGGVTHAIWEPTTFPTPSATPCADDPTTAGIQSWVYSYPVGLHSGSFPLSHSHCVGPHLTEPVWHATPDCPTHLTIEDLSLVITGGGIVRIDPTTGEPIALLQGSSGGHFLFRFSNLDPERGEAFRIPANHFVADVDVGRNGHVAAVGTLFPGTPAAPDDPFNAQGFILSEPFGPAGSPFVPTSFPFVDLTRDWQYDPVRWAWGSGLTTGVDATHFEPDRSITRGEVAVILHRLDGTATILTPHPFVDIEHGWQQAAIQWLSWKRITTGVDSTHFAPDRPITRAEVAVMLHRYVDSPPGSPAHPFVDVESVWQEEAIRWLSDSGATTGTDATHFSPERELTRAELVTLLYRLA